MKAVVGVDLGGAFQVGLDLLNAILFESPSLRFVNVIEPIMPDGGLPDLAVSNPMAQILDDLQKAGKELIDRTVAEHPGSTGVVEFGSPTGAILEVAEDFGADLVVVGSQHKTLVESLFSGSVTKSLTNTEKKSVLIGKQEVRAQGGLVAVFAHDMSEYSDKAVDKLVALAPQGLIRIVLVTADSTDPSIVAVVERNDPTMSGETFDVVESQLNNRQAEIAARLSAICSNVDRVVSRGKPNDVLNETMDSTNADLLILGAHGHGFIERLVVGSVALHEVTYESHNVLLLRA